MLSGTIRCHFGTMLAIVYWILRTLNETCSSCDSEACGIDAGRIASANGMAENMEHEGFDLPFLLKEILISVDELCGRFLRYGTVLE